MSHLWWIQLFWLALAVPGCAALRRWDPASLRCGFLFGLGRSYLASLTLLTPISVLGYTLHWPLWSLSGAYLAAVALGLVSLGSSVPSLVATRTRRRAQAGGWQRAFSKPSMLAALGGSVVCIDLALSLRTGTHLHGDAGYHIARVRMLIVEGLNNWDPIVAQQRPDVIYHTNLYHALIAVSAQLTRSDATLAWLAVWPFAKLLATAGAFQLGRTLFGAAEYGWLASLTSLASVSAYSVLPFPNTLAPVALLPMGLSAAIALTSSRRTARPAAWLAASAIALAQVHMLNAVFLAMVVAPVLLGLLLLRVLRRHAGKRLLVLGLAACAASLPWLLVAAGPRIAGMLEQLPSFEGEAAPPASHNADQPNAAAAQPRPKPPRPKRAHNAAPKKVYKAEHFRKLASGLAMFDPEQLRGPHDSNLIALALLAVTLALRPRKALWVFSGFIAATCAWLLVPPLCSVLLRVTGAPWAAMRITQVLAVGFVALVPAVPYAWLRGLRARKRRGSRLASRRRERPRAALQLGAALIALLVGWDQNTHGEPWTMRQLWRNAVSFKLKAQWKSSAARQRLLCEHIPAGETVMAHPRWDYGLPMLCRSFAVALRPERGWHGLPYMSERRADVEEFFREGTSGDRRLALLRKYHSQHVYTTNRLSRRILADLKNARVIAHSRQGAVIFIDL